MSAIDTCNVLLGQAQAVFTGPEGINAQLTGLAIQPALPPVATILTVSAPMDIYEKSAGVRYPVACIYCTRLKNTQHEKFRMFSGVATLVIEIRVSGENAGVVEKSLNSYVEAACEALYKSQGSWTSVGTYSGAYDVKFQAMRQGGKQFLKSAQIELEIQVSK